MRRKEQRAMKRGPFVSALAASPVLARRANAQSPVKLRVSGPAEDDMIGVFWALDAGIFAKNGLDVEFHPANSGAAIMAAVVGGSVDVGKGSTLPLAAAHAKGVAFVLEAPANIWNSDRPPSALVVAKGAPIRTGRDLNGKTVAVPALGDLYSVSISAWIDKHGGDSRTVKFLELPQRAAADAIAQGRVDAANLGEPLLNDAVQSGKCEIIGHAQEAIARRFVSTAYFCSADFAAKNADALARFRRSIYAAGAYVNAHRAERTAIVAKYTGVDPQTVAMLPPNVAAADPKELVPAMIQPLIDAGVAYKAIAAPFAAKDMIDPNAV